METEQQTAQVAQSMDQPKNFVYVGDTEEERIRSAQLAQIGIGIIQRYGQSFTNSEKIFMELALSQYIKPVGENEQRPPPQAQVYRQPQPAAATAATRGGQKKQ